MAFFAPAALLVVPVFASERGRLVPTLEVNASIEPVLNPAKLEYPPLDIGRIPCIPENIVIPSPLLFPKLLK